MEQRCSNNDQQVDRLKRDAAYRRDEMQEQLNVLNTEKQILET